MNEASGIQRTKILQDVKQNIPGPAAMDRNRPPQGTRQRQLRQKNFPLILCIETLQAVV
jgi:hypothetical protein